MGLCARFTIHHSLYSVVHNPIFTHIRQRSTSGGDGDGDGNKCKYEKPRQYRQMAIVCMSFTRTHARTHQKQSSLIGGWWFRSALSFVGHVQYKIISFCRFYVRAANATAWFALITAFNTKKTQITLQNYDCWTKLNMAWKRAWNIRSAREKMNDNNKMKSQIGFYNLQRWQRVYLYAVVASRRANSMSQTHFSRLPNRNDGFLPIFFFFRSLLFEM